MKKGFTLSEVLITLSIVGIVAVLTVPSVMKNYKNRIYVAQLQKTYSQIGDAAQTIMNDEHVDNFYETSAIGKNVCTTDETTQKKTCSKAGIEYFLTNYFKNIKKDCANSNNKCVGVYKNLNGSMVGSFSYYCVQTVNGAAICGDITTSKNVLSIFIDVNGAAEPNILGRDGFVLDIKSDASLSDYGSFSTDPGTPGATADKCSVSSGSVFDSAKGCLTSVIEAGWKMEY